MPLSPTSPRIREPWDSGFDVYVVVVGVGEWTVDAVKPDMSSLHDECLHSFSFPVRQGFLGLLHMEIVQQRLEREYDIDLIVTAPSVVYKMKMENGKEIMVDTPSKMPDLGRNDVAMEPYVRMEILTPSEYNGAIIELGQERRGELMDIKYLTPTRSTIVYELPLAEVITDFFNTLKSSTKGYGTWSCQCLSLSTVGTVTLCLQ